MTAIGQTCGGGVPVRTLRAARSLKGVRLRGWPSKQPPGLVLEIGLAAVFGFHLLEDGDLELSVDFNDLLRMEPDGGTTNVRNTTSAHWKRWLGVESRCVVPLTSFGEFDHGAKQDVWFALSPDRPLAFFAGIWTPQWTGVRKIKNGVETTDLFAFLTTEPNREVGAIHPKAMPVILTEQEEIETWMTAQWDQAKVLQRPLPDGALVEVARGVKKDESVG